MSTTANGKGGGHFGVRRASLPSTCYGYPAESLYDTSQMPDYDTDFLHPEDIDAFTQALAAPDPLQSPPPATPGPEFGTSPFASTDHLVASKQNSVANNAADGESHHLLPEPSNGATPSTPSSLFITAKNDWAPVYEKVAPLEGSTRPVELGAGSPAAPHAPSYSCSSSSSSWMRQLMRRRGATPPVPSLQSPPPSVGAKRSRRQQAQRRRAAASAASAASASAGKHARAKPGPGSGRRTRDETREGYLYGLLKWPFLLGVFAWIIGLSLAYLLTRLYIASYEQLVTWRGRREKLRRQLRATSNYDDWKAAANTLDAFLGNDRWKEENEFAFYDFRTVRRVAEQLRKCRARAEAAEGGEAAETTDRGRKIDDLKTVVEACVKNNFAGVENRHLYSRTYYGTKNLVQDFTDEVERSLQFLLQSNQLDAAEARALFKRLHSNYGRTALCLSGGASFAYYHLGVVKAMLDQDLLPDVITGTSGGALIAALVATRTNDELRQLLVPALAGRLTACREPFWVWIPRWWRTGARFDSVDWARQCSWWTRGSMTFREAYERTGRVLNVTCVPADPHSPTILCNYRTAPDCVIWSAVLASAAVPGILNPVVLMMKTGSGQLVPYSFGHKWKDGSLRTDIPIKALNLHFNVNFTVVSQVNPHVNLFFFSSRGSVGQPVTHRKGRGWRGGYLGSAFEEYLKQDLRKWLKLLRNLELLPRPLGQDWSQLWLQPFGGTVTIWPKSVPADFLHILSDPDPPRLARMLHEGQQSAFPPLKFVSNRLRIERLIEQGRGRGSGGGGGGRTTTGLGIKARDHVASTSIDTLPSDDDLHDNSSDGPASRLARTGRVDLLGFGSTTATSDENLSSSSSDLDETEVTIPEDAAVEKR